MVVVERALGEVQPGRDLVDRGAAVALLVDQLRGSAQKGLRGVAARLCLQHTQGRQLPGRLWPLTVFRGQAMDQQVADTGGHTGVLSDLMAADPGAHPVGGRQHDVGAGIELVAAQACSLRPLQQAAQLAEHRGVGAEHGFGLGAGQGADVVEHQQRRLLTLLDARQQRGMALEEVVQPRGHAALVGRGGTQGLVGLDGAQEAGGGQVFLLAVVVGDAVGHQAHAGGDAAEGGAAHPFFVEQLRRSGEDGLALFLVTLGGGGRRSGHQPLTPRRRMAMISWLRRAFSSVNSLSLICRLFGSPLSP